MSKRIAILDLLFNFPPTGGSWVDVYEVATRLQKQGHTVCLYVPDFTRYFPRSVIYGTLPFEVRYIQFSRFSFNRFTVSKRFMDAFDEFKPDFIFLTDGYFLKPHLVNAFSKKYKVILRFYAYEVFCGLNNHYHPELHSVCPNHILLDRGMCLKCMGIRYYIPKSTIKVVIGRNTDTHRLHFTQEFMSATAFLPSYPDKVKEALSTAHQIIVYNDILRDMILPYSKKVQVTPSGVDSQRFIPKPAGANIKKRILFSGRTDDPVKGFSVVVAACQKLWQKRQDFEVLITSNECKLPRVPFMNSVGWLTQEQLPQLYQSCDMCLVPSIWEEAFGITALEAMACGKPVIASSIGRLKQTIKDGETGFLVPPNDPDKLLDKITLLLDNDGVRAKVGNAARQIVVKEYDWDIIIDKYYKHLFI